MNFLSAILAAIYGFFVGLFLSVCEVGWAWQKWRQKRK
jgi:hypothetical protein